MTGRLAGEEKGKGVWHIQEKLDQEVGVARWQLGFSISSIATS